MIHKSLLMDDVDISLIDCDLRNELDNVYVIWMYSLSMIMFNYLFG